MKIGKLVKFCKNPPKDIKHCHIWKWCVGLLVNLNNEDKIASILFENKIYQISFDWVEEMT